MDTWIQALMAVAFVAILSGAFYWGSKQDWAQAKADEKARREELVPAGVGVGGRWAPDPYNPTIERWWNGAEWTDTWRYRQTVSSAQTAIAWIAAIFTLGYMLPWAVSASRGMPNAWAVGVLNLLLGWTGIGWIIALVMACTQRRP